MKCGKKRPVTEEQKEVECPNCEAKYPAGTNFCANCGTKLNK